MVALATGPTVIWVIVHGVLHILKEKKKRTAGRQH